MKDDREIIKLQPGTRHRLKKACVTAKLTYDEWINAQLDKTENQNKKK